MKILATIDFSTTSESLLRYTAEYAKQFAAEVVLVHAEPEKPSEDDPDYTPEKVCLKKDARALERLGINVTVILAEGPVCETLVEKARENEADLIIVGAHGHGLGKCKAPIGSIGECVLLRSRIPVLVIPAEY